MGAQFHDRGLILQQALLLGIIGYGIAYLLGQWSSKIPRRVLIAAEDLWNLALVVWPFRCWQPARHLEGVRVEPNKVLSWGT